MFDKLTRSYLRALGADPEALGRMRDCRVLNAQPRDYFARGLRHEVHLAFELTTRQWTLICACGAHGQGGSLLNAIDDWNAQLALYGTGDHASASVTGRAANIVALRPRKR